VTLIAPATRSGPAPTRFAPSRCRTAVVGFGTVGRAVARLVMDPRHARRLALTWVSNRDCSRKRVDWIAPGVRWTDSFEDAVRAPDVDIVVEVMGGIDAAFDCIRQALTAGKAVVTANKQVLARHGPELFRLAEDQGTDLRCEGAAGGAIPLVRALAEGLRGDEIVQVAGVLNGTSNFVLDRIEHGASFETAVADARNRGLAEANPSLDLDGHDGAAKLSVLAWFAFGLHLHPDEVARGSIEPITPADLAFARRTGRAIKAMSLVRVSERVTGGLEAWSGPALVPAGSPLAQVSGARNAAVVTGRLSGDTLLAGEGAGGDPTAVAVVSDLLAIAQGSNHARGRSELIDGRANAHGLPQIDRDRPSSEFDPVFPHVVHLTIVSRSEQLPQALASLHGHGLQVREVATIATDGARTRVAITLDSCNVRAVRRAVASIDGVSRDPAAVLPLL
jgi:homoserine dehydrogenase